MFFVSNAPELALDSEQLVKVAKALSDPTRFAIFQAIADSDEICCGELAKRWTVTQATVSHHLKVLADAGLISVRPQGQFHFYRANPEALAQYCSALSSVV